MLTRCWNDELALIALISRTFLLRALSECQPFMMQRVGESCLQIAAWAKSGYRVRR